MSRTKTRVLGPGWLAEVCEEDKPTFGRHPRENREVVGPGPRDPDAGPTVRAVSDIQSNDRGVPERAIVLGDIPPAGGDGQVRHAGTKGAEKHLAGRLVGDHGAAGGTE